MGKSHEPKITISARVDVHSAALAAAFLDRTSRIYSKSDLINACVEVVAGLAKQTTDLEEPEQYEEAFAILKRLGLEWSGIQAGKDRLRALQQDALSDLEPDQVAELTTMLNGFRAKAKEAKIEEEKSPLLREIEKLEL